MALARHLRRQRGLRLAELQVQPDRRRRQQQRQHERRHARRARRRGCGRGRGVFEHAALQLGLGLRELRGRDQPVGEVAFGLAALVAQQREVGLAGGDDARARRQQRRQQHQQRTEGEQQRDEPEDGHRAIPGIGKRFPESGSGEVEGTVVAPVMAGSKQATGQPAGAAAQRGRACSHSHNAARARARCFGSSFFARCR